MERERQIILRETESRSRERQQQHLIDLLKSKVARRRNKKARKGPSDKIKPIDNKITAQSDAA